MTILTAVLATLPLLAPVARGAGQVRITDVRAIRGETELRISYRVVNGSARDAYVACEEPGCVDPVSPRYVAVKDRALVIARRLHAAPPGWSYAAPPYVGFRRVPANGELEAQVALPLPVRTRSPDPRVRLGTDVDLGQIRRVRLELATLPCPDRANTEHEHEGALLVWAGSAVTCQGRAAPALRLQRIVTGQGPLRAEQR